MDVSFQTDPSGGQSWTVLPFEDLVLEEILCAELKGELLVFSSISGFRVTGAPRQAGSARTASTRQTQRRVGCPGFSGLSLSAGDLLSLLLIMCFNFLCVGLW